MKNINILAAILASFGGNPVVLAEEPYSIEWARQFGTIYYDAANAAATDASGNIFVTGYTLGNLNGEPNAGGSDAFLVKFDAGGSVLWTRLIGTSVGESGLDVAVDSAGNAFVSGRTRPPGSNGDLSGFVSKVDPDGSLNWTSQFGTSLHDQGLSLAVDGGGSVYVGGYTRGDLDGQTNSGGEDAFLRKLDSNGVLQWSRLLGTSANEQTQGVSVDSYGNVYVAGFTDGHLGGSPNNGGRDIFLAKYDVMGGQQWTTLLGSSNTEGATAVNVDSEGDVYLTGHSDGSLDGQSGNGFSDAVLAKYDANGVRLWTRLFGTPLTDDANDIAFDIATGSIFVTGWTYGDLSSTNQGTLDMFISKWSPMGSAIWTEQLGTVGSDDSRGLAVDAFGSVYVAGAESRDLFGPDIGGPSEDDAFLVKFTPEPAAFLMIAVLAMLHRRRR